MQGMNRPDKYADQVNDASTVLGWRQRGGADLSQSPAVGVAAQHDMDTSHLADRFPGPGYPAHQSGVEAARDTPRTELDPATASSRGAFQNLGPPDGSKSLAERFPTTNPDSNFNPQGGAAGRYDYLTAGAATVKTGPPAPRAKGTPQVAAMPGMTPLGIKPQGK